MNAQTQNPQLDPVDSRRAPGRTRDTLALPDHFFVVDPSAVAGGSPRTHYMPNADGEDTAYQFEYPKPTKVTPAHAMRFLKNGFKVAIDEGMKQLVKAARGADEGRNGHSTIDLREDEVIAALDELTKEALFKRASALPGGERFAASTTKQDLMAFILDHNRKLDQARNQVETADVGTDFSLKDLQEHQQEAAE